MGAFASIRVFCHRTHFPLAARDARRRAMGEAMATARVRPTRALRGNVGPASTRPPPRRADSQRSRFPVRQALAPSPAGAENWKAEILATWESANARQDPRFPDSQLADSRSLPATAAAGLRLAGAVIALASRLCPNRRC